MKRATTLALCSSLCLTVPTAKADDPKVTVAVAFCGGVILGVATGVMVIVGIRCLTKPKPPPQYPSWWYLPPLTNSPPDAPHYPTNRVAVIDMGTNYTMYDLSGFNIVDPHTGLVFTRGFAFDLEQNDPPSTNWIQNVRIQGWQNDEGTLCVIRDAFDQVIASNYTTNNVGRIDLMVDPAEVRLYRAKSL